MKLLKSILLVAPLLLSGCSLNLGEFFSKNKTSIEQTQDSNGSSSNATLDNSSSASTNSSNISNQQQNTNENNNHGGDTEETNGEVTDVVVTTGLKRIYFSKDYLSVNVGSRFYCNIEMDKDEGYEYDYDVDPITWTIYDTDIATVNQYGKIEGLKRGSTILHAETRIDGLIAAVKLFVINSETDIQKSWKKMGVDDHLDEKETIIIACPETGKAATDDDTGSHLHSTSVTFSNDKSTLTNVGGAAQFYVYNDYKGRNGRNVELLDDDKGKFLASTNTSLVRFYNTANSSATCWDIYWDADNMCWVMESATNVLGYMMYNDQNDSFNTYYSDSTAHLTPVSLYKLFYTINLD